MIKFPGKMKIYANKLVGHFPDAVAEIKGASAYPNIRGNVFFYQVDKGVLVTAEVVGLPDSSSKCDRPIFAMHIHEGGSCTGNAADPFANAGKHYDNKDCPHPQHAGDLPPLFSNEGYAFYTVFTNRFTVKEIKGRTVIVHNKPDDFTSQPAGNAGDRIACGVIR